MCQLVIDLARPGDEAWAKGMVLEQHYRHKLPSAQGRPMTYIVWLEDERVGLVMVGAPHANLNRKWWGYPGQPTQWQVADLSRIWLSPRIQKGGDLCRPDLIPGFIGWRGKWWPAAGSWLIRQILGRIQQDRVSFLPPVFLEQPYHTLLVISYSDPEHHRGTIYKAAGAVPMYADVDGNTLLNSSGKYGWCWPLEQPSWTWRDIEIERPRTPYLALNLGARKKVEKEKERPGRPVVEDVEPAAQMALFV